MKDYIENLLRFGGCKLQHDFEHWAFLFLTTFGSLISDYMIKTAYMQYDKKFCACCAHTSKTIMLKDTAKIVNFLNQFVLSFVFSVFKSAAHFLWSLRNSTNHYVEKKEHSNTGWLLKIFFDLLDCF